MTTVHEPWRQVTYKSDATTALKPFDNVPAATHNRQTSAVKSGTAEMTKVTPPFLEGVTKAVVRRETKAPLVVGVCSLR